MNLIRGIAGLGISLGVVFGLADFSLYKVVGGGIVSILATTALCFGGIGIYKLATRNNQNKSADWVIDGLLLTPIPLSFVGFLANLVGFAIGRFGFYLLSIDKRISILEKNV